MAYQEYLITEADIKRFWRKVDKSGDCWEWTASLQGKGYPNFGLKLKGTKTYRMFKGHRISWELHNGPILNNLHVLHRCDNRKCVNPAHLFLGTNQDNMTDRNKKKRQAIGEQIGISKLSWNDVETMRKLHAEGVSQKEIAKIFSVDTGRVCRIVNNKIWIR